MTGATSHPTQPVPAADRPMTLVWIDSREAIIVRREGGTTTVDRIESDVPAHRRATGHERHHPDVHYGMGTGHPHATGDARRLEHLARFLDGVIERLPAQDDLILIGPATVHERLAHRVRELDARHRNARTVHCETAPRLTRSQLVTRLRRAAGDEPRLRTVGAYRWTAGDESASAAVHGAVPRRVAAKRQSDRASLAEEAR